MRLVVDHDPDPSRLLSFAVWRGLNRCSQGFCNLAGDVVLNPDLVFEWSIIGLGPDNVTAVSSNETRSDPQHRTRLAYASVKNIPDAQCLSDISNGNLFSLEIEGRRSARHMSAAAGRSAYCSRRGSVRAPSPRPAVPVGEKEHSSVFVILVPARAVAGLLPCASEGAKGY